MTQASGIDGWRGKAAAVAVLLAAVGGIVYINREVLFPGLVEEEISPQDAAFAACMAARTAQIDQLVADGMMDAARAANAKERLAPVCQAQVDAAR